MKILKDYLYYEEKDPDLKIYLGDCREIMPLLPKVDLVLTDPPYGAIGGSKAIGGSNFVRANNYETDWDNKRFSLEQLKALADISKNQIIWGVNYYWDYFKPTNSLIVWDKKCQNGWEDTFSDAEIAWTSLEHKLLVYRHLWVGALKKPKTDDGNRCHPTQKPIQLMKFCIQLSILDPFLSILDPFLGSGTTLVACKELNRNGIGIEISEKYCEIAKKRLKATCKPLFTDVGSAKKGSEQGWFAK